MSSDQDHSSDAAGAIATTSSDTLQTTQPHGEACPWCRPGAVCDWYGDRGLWQCRNCQREMSPTEIAGAYRHKNVEIQIAVTTDDDRGFTVAADDDREFAVATDDDRGFPEPTSRGSSNAPTAPGSPYPRTVTCVWCGNRYRSVCPSDLDRGLQGSHCASDVTYEDGQWIVRGSYGSDEHDLERYVFVANPPSTPADPVCDECISQRLSTGDLREVSPESRRHPIDFAPRPYGVHGLISRIRRLLEDAVAMRQLITAVMGAGGVLPPELGGAIRAYQKYQRWTGEIDDGGEQYAEGAEEVANQLREAARDLEKIAAHWERRGASSPVAAQRDEYLEQLQVRLTNLETSLGQLQARVTRLETSSVGHVTTIHQLQQRLHVVEPVYSAAVALHRNGAAQTFEATERIERAVDRALETERRLAEGWSISEPDPSPRKAP